jgi:hypothetical protein
MSSSPSSTAQTSIHHHNLIHHHKINSSTSSSPNSSSTNSPTKNKYNNNNHNHLNSDLIVQEDEDRINTKRIKLSESLENVSTTTINNYNLNSVHLNNHLNQTMESVVNDNVQLQVCFFSYLIMFRNRQDFDFC